MDPRLEPRTKAMKHRRSRHRCGKSELQIAMERFKRAVKHRVSYEREHGLSGSTDDEIQKNLMRRELIAESDLREMVGLERIQDH